MIEITVNTRGADDDLDRLDDTRDWRKPMTQSLALLQDDMAAYPSPPSGSSYRRTGNLGRAWTTAQHEISTDGGGITGTIGNGVRGPNGRAYGPYVQSEEEQARVHRGRWRTDADVAERNTPAIVRLWEEWVNDQM